MQDGNAIGGEDAAAWLREHFRGEEITFRWFPDATADRGAYERLLEILFSPRPDTEAA